MTALLFIFVVVIGYLLGSICSAVVVSRLFSLPDPRVEGSQNPGATNVLRLAGKKYAVIVLIGDMLKGLIPVVLAKALGAGPVIAAFTGLAAVMGHMYPIFFGFRGGKGVATAIGALLGLDIILGVMVIVSWLLIANFTRYASLASLISIGLSPIYSLFIFNKLEVLTPLFFIALFVLYQHRNNVTRLIDGEEPKLRFSKSLNEEMSAVLNETSEEEQIQAEEINEPADTPTKTPKRRKKTPKI
ncbi:MAG: glycerol-3-phosphate 1-O-acyltransferase PlsY [Tatlockia sp.]|nr:glycerol-3-phosphate 1-O-acyltransferase PlsY [Tatlockia sp.]